MCACARLTRDATHCALVRTHIGAGPKLLVCIHLMLKKVSTKHVYRREILKIFQHNPTPDCTLDEAVLYGTLAGSFAHSSAQNSILVGSYLSEDNASEGIFLLVLLALSR